MNSFVRRILPVVMLTVSAGVLPVVAQQQAEYVLQPGDVIRITVVEHPEVSGQHKIRPDGRIT